MVKNKQNLPIVDPRPDTLLLAEEWNGFLNIISVKSILLFEDAYIILIFIRLFNCSNDYSIMKNYQ